jgi:predicted RND superfamily exporter protein
LSWAEIAVRRRRALLAGAAASALLAAAAAATLRVRTDFARLLPADAPSVVALHALAARKPSTAVVEVGIAAPDPAAAEQFAGDLARALRERLPADLASEVDDDDGPLRKFAWDHRHLRIPLDDLRRARAAVALRANPLYLDLEDDPSGALTTLAGQVEQLRRETVDRPSGYAGEEGRLRMLLVRAPFGDSEPEKGQRLLAAIRGAVEGLQRPPALQIGYAGDVVTAALEHDLVLRDVGITAALCLVLVLGVLRLAFRSSRAVLALAAALAVGCAWTFAWARLAIGELNSATAFLGPMVAGNGINAGIILLARYLEERRAGAAHRQALEVAVRTTARPTLLASACAAAADLSLLLTRFRAFSEFGAIAAAGMALCWVATYLTLPPILTWLDARKPLAAPRQEPRSARPPPLALAALAGAAGIAIVVLGVRGLPLSFQDDLRSLRSRSLPQSEAGAWSRRLDAAFGRNQAGGFFIGAQSQEDVQAVLDALSAVEGSRAPQDRVLGKVDALPAVLPGTPAEQGERIKLLSQLRVEGLRALARPPADSVDARALRELLPPEGLRPLTAADLPPALRRAFTETDGRVGLLMVVHPGPAFDGWSVRGIRRAVEELRALPLPPGVAERLQISGPEVIFADMMREVETALPRAGVVSALLASGLLAAMFSASLEGAAGLLALAAGLLGMIAALAALGVRLDFLSALAVPITIGIAGDYPLNMLGRLRQDRLAGAPWRGLRQTGGAVLLCSLTTGIGYAVLLASDTGAIRSFGLAALLGEASCLFAALVLAPAFARLAQALRAG